MAPSGVICEASSPPSDIVAVIASYGAGGSGENDEVVERLTVIKRRDRGAALSPAHRAVSLGNAKHRHTN